MSLLHSEKQFKCLKPRCAAGFLFLGGRRRRRLQKIVTPVVINGNISSLQGITRTNKKKSLSCFFPVLVVAASLHTSKSLMRWSELVMESFSSSSLGSSLVLQTPQLTIFFLMMHLDRGCAGSMLSVEADANGPKLQEK